MHIPSVYIQIYYPPLIIMDRKWKKWNQKIFEDLIKYKLITFLYLIAERKKKMKNKKKNKMASPEKNYNQVVKKILWPDG